LAWPTGRADGSGLGGVGFAVGVGFAAGDSLVPGDALCVALTGLGAAFAPPPAEHPARAASDANAATAPTMRAYRRHRTPLSCLLTTEETTRAGRAVRGDLPC
jgi:hypothetical protein